MKRLSGLAPERFSGIDLTALPEPRLHRNPAKSGGPSDSCAEPNLKVRPALGSDVGNAGSRQYATAPSNAGDPSRAG
jgi:hypothetical protein